MYKQSYFNETDISKKKKMRNEIVENESSVLEDIEKIAKKYIINNINEASLKE